MLPTDAGLCLIDSHQWTAAAAELLRPRRLAAAAAAAAANSSHACSLAIYVTHPPSLLAASCSKLNSYTPLHRSRYHNLFDPVSEVSQQILYGASACERPFSATKMLAYEKTAICSFVIISSLSTVIFQFDDIVG